MKKGEERVEKRHKDGWDKVKRRLIVDLEKSENGGIELKKGVKNGFSMGY